MLFMGVMYITIPIIFCLNIAYNANGYNYQIILGTMLLISMNDIGAYFAGKSFGKNKLFERISPKKTWEGTAGGVLLSLILSYFLAQYFEVLDVTEWVIISLITSVFGSLGDLVESMIKRDLNVKDSGKIIPGHGGILDRFDSLLIVAPFVFFYFSIKELIIFISN